MNSFGPISNCPQSLLHDPILLSVYPIHTEVHVVDSASRENEESDCLLSSVYPSSHQSIANMENNDVSFSISRGLGPGRPSLAMIPGIKDYVEYVLYDCSAAHNRRRNCSRIVIGVSLKELRDQIVSSFELARVHFPKLSTSTVRMLGLPPNISHSNAASRYHGLTDMKKLNIENNYFPDSGKKHDSFCQVALCMEQLSYCYGLGDVGISIISMDDAAEEHLGSATLTNRFHQVRRMSSPRYPPNTVEGDYYDDKLTPCGYMVLQHKRYDCNKPENLKSPNLDAGHYGTYIDKKNRLRIIRPHNGPLYYFYTAQKLFPVNLETHLAHLYEVSPSTTKFLAVLCDKGTVTYDLFVHASLYKYKIVLSN